MDLKILKKLCKKCKSGAFGNGYARVEFVQRVSPEVTLQLIERCEKLSEVLHVLQNAPWSDREAENILRNLAADAKEALSLYGSEVPLI